MIRAPRPPRRRPVVIEVRTKTRRHLVLAGVGHTACGRGLEGMGILGRVNFPWHPTPPIREECCSTCRRVLASGGLGFWVTRRGNILTEEDIVGLAAEAEQGYDISHLLPGREPVSGPGNQPGPDAMHWHP